MAMLSRLINQGMRYVEGLDRQEWLVVLVISVLLGALCLRGFGSRSSY